MITETMTPKEYVHALRTFSDADLNRLLGIYGDNDRIIFGSEPQPKGRKDIHALVEYFLDSGKWKPNGVEKETIREGIALEREIAQLSEEDARKKEDGFSYDKGKLLHIASRTWYDFLPVSATCHFGGVGGMGCPAKEAELKNPDAYKRIYQMAATIWFHERNSTKSQRRTTAEGITDVVSFLLQRQIPFYARLERKPQELSKFVLYDPRSVSP